MHNKIFSVINILGLGLGIACSLLIYLWVQDELSYDRFHEHENRLYKVMVHQLDKDGSVISSFDATPGLLAEAFKNEIPEVAGAATVLWEYEPAVAAGEKIGREKGRCVSPDFFRMFTFPLVKGDVNTVLSSPDEIVISLKMADTYFPGEDPVGKVIRVNNNRNFRVTGVMADIPENSSLRFDFVLPIKYSFDDIPWLTGGWNAFGPHTYVMLRPNTSVEKVNSKIRDFLTRHDGNIKDKAMSLQPYGEMYLYSRFTKGVADGGRIEYVRLFSIIAVFIILIACANFMNLTTARSVKRAKEVGIRKAIGADRGRLFGQFIGEAIITTMLAVIVAIVLVLSFLPVFNDLTGKHLYTHLYNPIFIIVLPALVLVTGFVAGSYPALFLSSLNPIAVLKGVLKTSSSATVFRKALVIFQFSLSIVLIICTLIVYRQMHYVQTKNLGLDRENVIYVPLEGDLSRNDAAFRATLLQSGGIESMTNATAIPTDVGMHTESVSWTGKDPNEKVGFWQMSVDYGFTNTLKVQLKAGRDFDRSFGGDSANFLINEAAAKVMGMKEPVGQIVTYEGKPGRIIGVIKDFHLHSLHEPITPLFINFMTPNAFKLAVIRIQAGKTRNVIATLTDTWKRFNPEYPLDYKFADDLFAQQYRSEMMVEKLANIFAFLAIFISCMGLFGLAMYTAEQRTREISIRKVLGASAAGIIYMLVKYFIKLVMIAVVIAFPLAWWAMYKWLQNFAYRINISWWIFLVAGVIVMLIASLTVSFQAIKAATVNPVNNLRRD